MNAIKVEQRFASALNISSNRKEEKSCCLFLLVLLEYTYMESQPSLNRFEYGIKIILYVFTFLLPLFVLPSPIGVELGREIIFGGLIILASILWLFSILTRGQIRYQHSPILYASGLFLFLLVIATLFSQAPLISALHSDAIAETLLTATLGFLVMVLVGSVLKNRAEVGTLFFILLAASTLSGVINFLQLFGLAPYRFFASFAEGRDFNVIGTMNGLTVFYTVIFLMAFGLLLSSGSSKWKSWARVLLGLACLVFLGNILLINFRTSWIILLGGGVFLFGLMFKNIYRRGRTEGTRRLGWRYWSALLLLILSVGMLMVRNITIRELNLPAEVSPAFSTTVGVGKSVIAASAKSFFFGSGPATFGLDWSRYRDPLVNQTIFWGVRFNQGQSWVATIFPTLGVVGLLVFFVFIVAGLAVFLRSLLNDDLGEAVLPVSAFLGFMGFLLAAFFYPANFSFIMAYFLLIGILSVFLKKSAPAAHEADETAAGDIVVEDIMNAPETISLSEPGRNFWDIRERVYAFEKPWVVFLSSLLVIFLIAMGAAGLYLEFSRLRAALVQQAGLNALNRGEIDRAINHFEKATLIQNQNYRIYQGLVQVTMEKIKSLVGRASQGENVQQDFQSTVAQAIQAAQSAARLYPNEPLVWRTQGALYELIIPFVQGAEQSALASYKQASELDPANPAIYTDAARAVLTYSDRLQFLAGQASQTEKDQFEAIRAAALQEVRAQLGRSLELKPDYATAHFLAAQTALRQGNAKSAIESAERAKLSAPFDTGIAFQLGLLHYQNNDLNRAEAEFQRALSLNNDYSNARYFLGLIYDRRGERSKAIEQFEKVASLNPGNGEIPKILANLRNGKDALENISPPGPAPERRPGAPVNEEAPR